MPTRYTVPTQPATPAVPSGFVVVKCASHRSRDYLAHASGLVPRGHRCGVFPSMAHLGMPDPGRGLFCIPADRSGDARKVKGVTLYRGDPAKLRRHSAREQGNTAAPVS